MAETMDGPMGSVIAGWVAEFRRTRKQVEDAVGQLTDDQFRTRLTPHSNSCALIVKHIAGNMRSRWTDWLTSDGEKPDRDRENEFADQGESRAELMQRLDAGWALVFAAVGSLRPGDLSRTVTIRGEPHTVPAAVERQIAHYAYHAGQVQLIARIVHGIEGWRWNSVAPGQSGAFNRAMAAKFGGSGAGPGSA
jgi:uncharacterized damage-inducible protein DinB